MLTPEVSLQVYLLDDGSTDGTTEAVLATYSKVKVFKGNGSLFWNRGMRLVFSEAFKVHYDYYLWLNDDTLLEPNALQTLLESHNFLTKQDKQNSIVVGSTRDLETGELTYGGVVRSSRWRPLRLKLVAPRDKPQACETMNGNCVLVPHTVAEIVGTLDNSFTHKWGDYDYGLRAFKLGCSVWVAPGYVGTCSRNSVLGTWEDTTLSFHQRWKKMIHPKGIAPREWSIFARRHGGIFWYVYCTGMVIRLVRPSVLRKLRLCLAKEQP